MKIHKLTRNEANRLSRNQSSLVEDAAADKYGFSTVGAERFDGQTSTGTVYEVKSCLSRYNDGTRGRFRLWASQHDTLARQDRRGSAWYVFGLVDVSERPPVIRFVRKAPAKVGRTIAGKGGFNASGHPNGPQIKLPWSLFFDQ
jgi:hypothetical protein